MLQPKVGQVFTVDELGFNRRVYTALEVQRCIERGGGPMSTEGSQDTHLPHGLQALCVLKTEDITPGEKPTGLFLILSAPSDPSLQLRGFIATDQTVDACMTLNTPES